MEEKRIEAFELRKNREQNRKFNKQVSEIRKQEKSQDRKTHNEDLSKLRKSSDSGEREGRLNKILDNKPVKSRKREGMVRLALCALTFRCASTYSSQDKKYGFGAKDRKMAKMNDKK